MSIVKIEHCDGTVALHVVPRCASLQEARPIDLVRGQFVLYKINNSVLELTVRPFDPLEAARDLEQRANEQLDEAAQLRALSRIQKYR